MHDAKRLIYARSHLEGQAYRWYSAHKSKIKTWSDFERLFLDRFAAKANSIATLLSQRVQLPGEPVQAYADGFLNLHDRLRIVDGPLPDSMQTNKFIGGLHHALREKVLSRGPLTVEDALSDAVYCENYMGAYLVGSHQRRPLQPAVDSHGYPRNVPPPRDRALRKPRHDYDQFDHNHGAKPDAEHSRLSYQDKENAHAKHQAHPSHDTRPPAKDPKEHAIEELTRRVKNLRFRHFEAVPQQQHYMDSCQSSFGSSSCAFEKEKAYLAEKQDILQPLHAVCEDDTSHDVAQQYHMDVPAHPSAPTGATMLSRLHDLQASMDELSILFYRRCSPNAQPNVDTSMETCCEPALAQADLSAEANEGSEDCVDNSEEYEQTEEDLIPSRQTRHLTGDTLVCEPRHFCPAPAELHPPPRETAPEPPPATAPYPAAPAAAAACVHQAIHGPSPRAQDPVGQIECQLPMPIVSTHDVEMTHSNADTFHMEYSPPPSLPPTPPAPALGHGDACHDDSDLESERVVYGMATPTAQVTVMPFASSKHVINDMSGDGNDNYAHLPKLLEYACIPTIQSTAAKQEDASPIPYDHDFEGTETALHTVMKHRGGTQPHTKAPAFYSSNKHRGGTSPFPSRKVPFKTAPHAVLNAASTISEDNEEPAPSSDEDYPFPPPRKK